MPLPFMVPNSELDYLNAAGQIALKIVIGVGNTGGVTVYNPDKTVAAPGFYETASDNVAYVLYPNGNILAYRDEHADHSSIQLQFNDTAPYVLFGENNDYSHGPLFAETKTTTTGIVTTEFFADSFDAPGKEVSHLVQYDLSSPTSPHLLSGTFDPATHMSTLSLLDAVRTTPLINYGFGTLDKLISQDGATLVGNDGSSLVGNDGSSILSKNHGVLVGNDGSSLISATSGTALVGNDGSSFALKAGVSLVGNDGSSLVGNDGSSLRIALLAGNYLVSNGSGTLVSNASLVGTSGGTLVSEANGTLISPDVAGLVGNDGSSLVGDNGAGLAARGGGALLAQTASLVPSNISLLVGNDGSSLIQHDLTSLFGGGGIASPTQSGNSAPGAPTDNTLADAGTNFGNGAGYNIGYNTSAPRQFTALDVAGSTATTSTLAVGLAVTGALETIKDHDWFAVSLTEGHIYQIDLKGAATHDGTLGDPWLRLFDSGGLPVAQIDDGGVGNNSQLIYTALATGTYYAEASGRGDAEIGTYALSLAEAPQTITLNPVAGDNVLSAGEQAADSAAGLIISGTTTGIAAGHALTVALNGHNYAATVAGDGTWQTTIAPADVVKLAPGSRQVSVGVDGANDHATEVVIVTAEMHSLGNAFMQPHFQTGPLGTPVTAVLANGTFVAADGVGFGHSFQLFNSSGTAISPEISPFVPAGIVDDVEIVPASVAGGGGFAAVFSIRTASTGLETWYADFYNANGVPLQTNVQLPLPADPQDALGYGYQSAAATMTATPNGGYFMAEDYSQSIFTVGSPSSFPAQILEIGGSFFDKAGQPIATMQVNGVLKTSIDGIAYDGSNSASNVNHGVAALKDGSVAVVYVDRQFSTDPDLHTIVNSQDISVDIVSPTGTNLWIDVNADPFNFFSGPLIHNFHGNGTGIVALSATTFGVIWDETYFNNGVTTHSLMLKTYDESGFALSGEITMVGNVKAHSAFGSVGTSPVALGNGNFVLQYDDVANNQTVIAAFSSTGAMLDSIAFPIDTFGKLYSLAAAPDGSFYVTTAPDANSGFTTQHYALGTSFVPVTNASPVVTGSVTFAAIAENSGAHVFTQAQLLGNATDADGPSLTATNLAIATGIGTLVDNHNGTWSYTPATGDSTAASFSYQVTDGLAAPVADSATLDITPIAGPTADAHWMASVDLGTHPAGWLPTAVGDFNHDGTSDILWQNVSTGAVDLWKMSNGQWAGSVALGAHPTSSGWQIAGAGDFNHDGTSDVLWSNAGSGQTDIWQFSNGQWAASISPGSHPLGYQVAGIGDFNHDGTSDVLWYNPTTTDVDIWKISNGQWAGSAAVGTHPAGWQPAGVGDFNGDGTSDVLWYNSTTNNAEIWKISNGQWAGSVNLGQHPAGWAPAGVGDFNGDGTSDVLWSNAATGNVEIWEIANGQWAASVNLGQHPAGWQPAGVGDFNHDGTSDILWREAATGHTETWLLGNH